MSTLDLLNSLMTSSVRGWRGTSSFSAKATAPEQLLKLYDMEGCPYCRLVREVLCELDLDAMIYPCPKGGMRFRPEALDQAGINQFPILVDPNTGVVMLESADIVNYLYETYGNTRKRVPARGPVRQFQVATSMAATATRSVLGARGIYAKASSAPEQPLELYSFESSPYSRPVRELMCELELPYHLRNFGKSRWQEMGPPGVRRRFFPDAPITSPNRQRMFELTGRFQVPYLIDPNTGMDLYESTEILRYLNETYGGE